MADRADGEASTRWSGAVSRRLPPPCRYVYVIGPETGLQKIGIATDPRSRLAALQTASPAKLKIHTSVAVPFVTAHAVERRAHQALRGARVRGEWFDVAPEVAVTKVKAAAAMCVAMKGVAGAMPLFDFAEGITPPPKRGWRLGVPSPADLRTGVERTVKGFRRGMDAS